MDIQSLLEETPNQVRNTTETVLQVKSKNKYGLKINSFQQLKQFFLHRTL